jgi:hypothetical protein
MALHSTPAARRLRALALGMFVMALTIPPVTGFAQPDVTAPVWAKPGHFWFRKAIDGGHLYFTVDTVHGVKEPLFDHQRLAIEINLRTGYEFTPLTLPFVAPESRFIVKYDGSNAYIQEGAMAVEFALDGTEWRCDLQTKWNWNKVPPTDYECLPKRPAPAAPLPTAPARLVSPNGRVVAFIREHNVWLERLDSEAPAMAVTTDGTAAFGYDPGSIVWADDSQSVTVYRLHSDIWDSPSITANVTKLIAQRTIPVHE